MNWQQIVVALLGIAVIGVAFVICLGMTRKGD